MPCKAAERQGRDGGDRYLRRVRDAVMLERRNIARPEVVLELAAELPDADRLDRDQLASATSRVTPPSGASATT